MTNNKGYDGKLVKARYWAMIAYPENMVENWREIIADVLQVPFVYCVHDKDSLTARLSETLEEIRKTHVHIGLAYDGPTTFETVKRLINLLSKPGKICCPVGEPIINWAYFYKYLIHDTPGALAANKHVYEKKERIEGNNFDIELYSVTTERERRMCLKGMCKTISVRGVSNFMDFYNMMMEAPDPDGLIFDTISAHHGLLERLCKGNYLKGLPGPYKDRQ